MNEKRKIVSIENPEEAAWGIIGRGVAKYNREKAGDNQFQRLCYGLMDGEDEIAGGILCEVYWGWLYIDLLWVREELRGLGYGKRLLEKAEQEAKKLGASYAYLDTFSFQAPDFYKQYGYRVFGELDDFPQGQKRFFLRKKL